MTECAAPLPLFDTLENIAAPPESVIIHLDALTIPVAHQEFTLCLEFLKSYTNSRDTFTAYRREVERYLHWSWLICKKSVKEVTRNDFRDYLQFVNKPPKTWLGTKTVNRFIIDAMGLRQPNPEWRPFVAKVSKTARRLGKKPSKAHYQLSNKSMQAIFATLSSFYTFLQQESYLEVNPIALIRQKKSYTQHEQTRKVTRKLSKLQWHFVIVTAEEMAAENLQHERTLFLMSAFYLMGLRISELAYQPGRAATMASFSPDKHVLWWYTTVGKGNKIRDVAVPDELLST